MAVVDAFNAGNNVPGRHFSMMWRHLGSAHETARRPPQITLLRQPFDALGSGLRRLDATIDARGIPPGNMELRRRSRRKTRGNPQEWGGGVVADEASVGILRAGAIPFLRRAPTRPRAQLSGFGNLR